MNRNETYVGREVEQRMSGIELILHALMIICTCGMWYPIYHVRKTAIKRTTKIYSA
jgi:hypothetical protein